MFLSIYFSSNPFIPHRFAYVIFYFCISDQLLSQVCYSGMALLLCLVVWAEPVYSFAPAERPIDSIRVMITIFV